MRIVKKQKIDVKKFMEEIKANRTNRSYTSIERRNTRPTEIRPQNRALFHENFSKGSAPPQMFQSPSFNEDSYRFYSNYSQMSQNSQPYMQRSQLNSVYNPPQLYYPYRQPIINSTPGLSYNMQGYHMPNPHSNFVPIDQFVNQSPEVVKPERGENSYGTDLVQRKGNSGRDMQSRMIEPQQKVAKIQDQKQVEHGIKNNQNLKIDKPQESAIEVDKRKIRRRKKQNKQTQEQVKTNPTLQIKKQLEEVINKQMTEIIEEKKQAKIEETIWEDFNNRLQTSFREYDLQVAAERLKELTEMVSQMQIRMAGHKLEEDTKAWQRLEEQVFEKIGA